MSSSERFGYEWNKYPFIDHNYEAQFKNWIYPLNPEFFKNKKVLDAGCGMGRNSFWALKWKAKGLIAFDFDKRSVEAAKNNLAIFSNVQVFYKSIYEISWQNEFDVVFCVGVIHHLENPCLALKNLLKSLKPGGLLVVWVYSYEGNEWIVKYVDPIRKNITSKLPVAIVHFLSYFCSLPLWLFLKIFKGSSDYLRQLSTFKFWHIHSIVFDQLIPKVANYWTKNKVSELFKNMEFQEIGINRPPNNCGWTVIIKK